jgi:SAM-dependent methyltransferase
MKCYSNIPVYDFLIDKFNFSEKNKFEAFLDSYYLKKYHLDRLVYVSNRILPFVKPNSKILDLGSDGIFPYVAKSFAENVETYAISHEDNEIYFSDDGKSYSKTSTDFDFSTLSPDSTIKLQKCDLDKERLPFEDNSIDVITCFEVLEHLNSDPMCMMHEVNRVLKRDGGLFFLSTPNINSLKALKKVLSLESPYFWPPYSQSDGAIGHVKEYSINELRLLFENSGFSIRSFDTFNHKNDSLFSHDIYYQTGLVKGAEKNFNESDFDSHLDNFLGNIELDRSLLGDYSFITSERKCDPIKRYYFPLYESYR